MLLLLSLSAVRGAAGKVNLLIEMLLVLLSLSLDVRGAAGKVNLLIEMLLVLLSLSLST
jgi:hypothetical protein